MKKSRGRDAPRQLGHWAGRNGPTLSYQPGNRVRGNTSASYLPVRANHSISSGGNFIGGPPRINGVEHNLRDAWRPPSRTCRTAYACVCLCVRARARAGRTQLSGQRARSAWSGITFVLHLTRWKDLCCGKFKTLRPRPRACLTPPPAASKRYPGLLNYCAHCGCQAAVNGKRDPPPPLFETSIRASLTRGPRF